jgi:hypothetical protein
LACIQTTNNAKQKSNQERASSLFGTYIDIEKSEKKIKIRRVWVHSMTPAPAVAASTQKSCEGRAQDEDETLQNIRVWDKAAMCTYQWQTGLSSTATSFFSFVSSLIKLRPVSYCFPWGPRLVMVVLCVNKDSFQVFVCIGIF